MSGKRDKHNPKYKPKRSRVAVSSESPEAVYSEQPLVVFISSMIDSMRQEREAVDRAIRGIPITRPWKFEDTPASSQPVEESYLSKVRICDIFVLVLGREYSNAVAREFQTALESGKRILAFVHNGARDEEQRRLVASITTKCANYDKPQDLQHSVAGAIWDELIRAYRSYIPPNAAQQVIQQIPLPTRKLEDLIGYFIIGVDDPAWIPVFKAFGAVDVPADLEELYPQYEALPVINVLEINTAVRAIQRANQKSYSYVNRHSAFLRELKREAAELASHYIKAQRTNTPQPEVTMPGIEYYFWGMEHNFARLVRLMRLEEFLKEPIKIERTRPELMFRDADHFVKVGTLIAKASRDAAGDLEELRRLLILNAALFSFDESEENDS